ncbi:MAG TPA: diguanylate cyclase, partial [Desulfurivibrionaceae bacterium]|nr:diguanylate cyclase [Desulfurivibrionaceae bacterium]
KKARAGSDPCPTTCHALTHNREKPCTGEEHPCPLKQVKASGSPVVMEHVHQNAAGESCVVEVHGYPIFDGDGRVVQMIETSIDITERRRMENLLREQKKFTAKLIKYSAVPTFVLDDQHRVLFWNKPCEMMTGIKAADMVGTTGQWRPFYTHPRPCLADFVLDGAANQANLLYSFIEKSRVVPHGYHAEGWFENVGGQRRYLVFEAAPIFDEAGKIIAAIETLRDMTTRKEIEEALAFQAMRDELTGIYNRRMLDELLKQEALRAQRYQTPFTLIMFDLDYFKNINDTYGHDVGDAVLREVSAVMQKQIRATDHLGRWGGEEFMLVAPETVLAQAIFLAEKLRRQVQEHHFDQVQSVTMSIGVGEYRVGEGVDSLIKRVDDALYRAKESGRNVVQQAE